jgi:deoxyribonuclease-4
MGAGETAGIRLMIESLNHAHDRTEGARVLSVVETTAGQGTLLGHRFEQIAAIIAGVEDPERVGVCIDTCHIFAAGYDISNRKGYESTLRAFEEIVGLKKLVAIHVNDSKGALGSHIDRHEHIGKGKIGREGFRYIMKDTRLLKVPKLLETPKGEDLREDKMNLAMLRRLAR